MLILESVAICQQPSMEVPLANWIVMADGPPFEGHECENTRNISVSASKTIGLQKPASNTAAASTAIH
jgi:hypothetical protein